MSKSINIDQSENSLNTNSFLEYIPDAIYILSMTGDIQYVNKAGRDLLRKNQTELIGQHILKYFDFGYYIPDSKENDITFSELINMIKNEGMEIYLLNGEQKCPVELNFRLMKAESGKTDYMIASVRDISHRKENEPELHKQHLWKISQRHIKDLGQLAVNIVHNMSQPITSIQLLAELTQKQIQKQPIDKKNLDDNLDKMIQLLNTVISSISNIRNIAYASQDNSFKSVDVVHMFKELEHQISYELMDKNIRFEKKLEQDLPRVLTNPVQLQQAIQILVKYILTAFEYLDNEKLKSSAKSIKEICISVNNIDHKWIDIKISDCFEDPLLVDKKTLLTIYNKMKIESANTGFDLTLASIMISHLGGDLRIVEKITGGISFSVRLPVYHDEEHTELLNLIELLHRK